MSPSENLIGKAYLATDCTAAHVELCKQHHWDCFWVFNDKLVFVQVKLNSL